MERAAEGDEFVVLACDGIWDVMTNEELCEFVRSRLQVCEDLEKVCNAVVDTCLHKVRREARAHTHTHACMLTRSFLDEVLEMSRLSAWILFQLLRDVW